MDETYDKCPGCGRRILLDPVQVTRSDRIVGKEEGEEFTNGYNYSILCECGLIKIVLLSPEMKDKVDKRYN